MAFRLVDDGNLKQNYVEISILCDLAPTIMCRTGKPDFLYIQVFSRSRLLIAGKSAEVVARLMLAALTSPTPFFSRWRVWQTLLLCTLQNDPLWLTSANVFTGGIMSSISQNVAGHFWNEMRHNICTVLTCGLWASCLLSRLIWTLIERHFNLFCLSVVILVLQSYCFTQKSPTVSLNFQFTFLL